jgi:hypothetical protein
MSEGVTSQWNFIAIARNSLSLQLRPILKTRLIFQSALLALVGKFPELLQLCLSLYLCVLLIPVMAEFHFILFILLLIERFSAKRK